ncbi:hypothetical protein HPP92_002505 [Vanilla planifolia]|uniref:Cation efflux protein transmembrane domain-containing protein n=1 Tax=Vanilla planifolia TaxID=51239 RepID=A0A835VMK1_VANPL|nr:hypothetical protein HPP92_002505 [Vanilla planifolia]
MPILLPFLSGFLGFYERSSGNASPLRQLGKKRTRLASLAITTVILFIPASISFFITVGGKNENSVSAWDMGWSLVNTVLFGVVLNENFSGDDKVVFRGKDINREFLVTLFCTLVWELVYLPNLSLPGFMLCGFLLWIAVWELGSSSLHYSEIGSLVHSESLYSMIRNPIQHIMSEKKTRKIAFFLLINTTYMFVEFVAGFMSNSLGLISDACHMLFDCAALAIGLYASYISRLPANSQFNYGRGRFEVLSGYANAVFLVLVGAMIVVESMERILDPQEISTSSLLAVSIGGLLVNIIGLVFFHEEHHHAHGAGGSCTHPHIHSCSNSHSKLNSNANSHLISHSHSHVTHVHDHNNEHSLDCHSHSNHHHHHHHHHEKQNDSCDHHKKGDRHSHCSIHKGNDHHCNHEEHYRHDHINHAGDHNHENSSKHNHEHQNLLVGMKEDSKHSHIDHNMEGIFCMFWRTLWEV